MTSHIALGLWPIAGITTVGVTDRDARETIEVAMECGVTTFDTAYSYGYSGQSDRLIGHYVASHRDRYCVLGKVGQRWTGDQKRVVDGSPEQLTADARASLERSGLDFFDVLFLHSPDPDVPLEVSAAAMQSMLERGWCKRLGISNMTADQLAVFSRHAECDAIQCPLNFVQPDNRNTLISEARQRDQHVFVFWSLMKGLLAGKIDRQHVFDARDSRPNYPIFQGALREAIHDAMDALASVAAEQNMTMAQLAIGWALSQPGVTMALVGARRPEQIRETAAARPLPEDLVDTIDEVAASAVSLARG